MCYGLTTVNILDSVIEIGIQAFSWCSLSGELSIPSNVQLIGTSAFSLNTFESVVIHGTNSIVVDSAAFAANTHLVNVTILSRAVNIFHDSFDKTSLRNIYLNRSVSEIDGFPKAFNRYACDDKKCGCREGFENLLPQSSGLFACTACQPGYSNSITAHQGLCEPCPQGRYANETALDVCEQCEAGKYGAVMNAALPSSCEPCPPRKYAKATGSSVCAKCPAGSECPSYGTASYTPCAVGRYNSFAGQIECEACPSGKYGPQNGSAICLDLSLIHI